MLSNKFNNIILNNFDRKLLYLSKKCVWSLPKCAQLDTDYLCNPNNVHQIEENITNRKGVGNIKLVHDLKNKLQNIHPSDKLYESIRSELYSEMLKIPNKTHPAVAGYGNNPKIVKEIGQKKHHDVPPKEFQEIAKRLKLLRTDQLGNLSGNKSYYLLGEMAELEHALIRYVVSSLIKHKFDLISVPDILHRDIIEGCGMNTQGSRTQVYTLDPQSHGPDLCLSGTSEMALAGFLANKTLTSQELPLKLAAVSRCYRAETSNLLEERGIYRVHEFSKVEMFVASLPEESEQILEEIRQIQEDCFQSLGLHFQVLDMPPHELGAQAYRKYDIEAWLTGRQIYGEISSCSNCLDYQSRRLNIKFETKDGCGFVHTLNGTACAIPRLLIALMEEGQNRNGTITLPEVLHPFMGGKGVIAKQKSIPELKLVKNKK
ncbi:serine--tRNA ligase, mitochondrial [Asbolus verrucosus]|uniref:serine--tRNA ligase n=1 Tax=Asbolus verrucosus TaxID=1661398 RepID=A0A482W639_ASBVE|nr:serine--tRNA ligase, mitochondrial [Asbolus verrucosus]